MADAANEEFQFLSNRPEPFGETDLFPEKSDENLWEVWEAIGFQSKEELGRFMGGLAKANEKEMLEVGRMLAERTKPGVLYADAPEEPRADDALSARRRQSVRRA